MNILRNSRGCARRCSSRLLATALAAALCLTAVPVSAATGSGTTVAGSATASGGGTVTDSATASGESGTVTFAGENASLKGYSADGSGAWYKGADGALFCCSTGDGALLTGFACVDGRWYYFDEGGVLQTGWIDADGQRYYARTDGKVGKKYGALLSGWQTIDGSVYYFKKTASAGKFGLMLDGWKKIGGKIFCFQDGKLLTGLTTIGKKLFCFSEDGGNGERGSLVTGWKEIDGATYCFRTSGKIGKTRGAAYRGTTVTIDGTSYTFTSSGALSEESAGSGSTGSTSAGSGLAGSTSTGTDTTTDEAAYETMGCAIEDLTLDGLTAAQTKFVHTVGALAHADMLESGILASVTIAQAILESSFGTSTLARKANNLFGMRKSLSGNTWPSVWGGSVYTIYTKEYLNGGWVYMNAAFRSYDTLAQSIADHSAYLAYAPYGNNSCRYAGITTCRNYKRAAQIIRSGGYATSPTYVSVLCGIIEKYNLTVYDKI